MASPHRIYLIPGMFGFARLAGYDYFEHVERALRVRFDQAGVACEVRVVPSPPTASIRRRARVVADVIHRDTGHQDGPIHLIGHSTGGLDARLLASPSAALDLRNDKLEWRRRVRTVVTMSTPHYGTPLASFFTTVSGTHLLYALSLLTVTTLSIGGPPLSAVSALVAGIARLDKAFGLDIQLLDRTTELLMRFIGDQGREEVRLWLEGIRQDQGGIVQICPEGMDLFTAAVDDADDVRYGCLASAAPPPGPLRLVGSIRSPYAALSAAIYSTLHTMTARQPAHYPYPEPDRASRDALEAGIGRQVGPKLNDGVVPTMSMLWGEVLWAGRGDHLDMVGHFQDDGRPKVHTDWVHCGANFGRARFGDAMDAIARFALAG